MSSGSGVSTFDIGEGVTLPAVGIGCAFGNWVDSNKFFGFNPKRLGPLFLWHWKLAIGISMLPRYTEAINT